MSIVPEYEIFKNDKNALAFFFYRQPILDQNPTEGPFSFIIEGNSILAGTKEFYSTFSEVNPESLEIAKERGVIMLMEFENQQPVRCTPCYLKEAF